MGYAYDWLMGHGMTFGWFLLWSFLMLGVGYALGKNRAFEGE